MSLRVAKITTRQARSHVCSLQQHLLCLAIGRCQARTFAILPHAAARYLNLASIAQHHSVAPFSADVPVCSFVEGVAPPTGRRHAYHRG